jgi:single-strand selective monofunctional uracil DNA glycosylase
MRLKRITDDLVAEIKRLKFGPPVSHVYNPLEYARKPYDQYLKRYAAGPKQVLFLGMNPGPWGMAQTGVPFGEVDLVKNWLNIYAKVHSPANEHPKRPVMGFDCPKSEVSGKRLWGWIKATFKTPERFFKRFFVGNYCPLVFMEAGGRNRTPNNLPAAERKPLLEICDRALRRTVEELAPEQVIGVGQFAAGRARVALEDLDVKTGCITHPSPANPKANRGWARLVETELEQAGVRIK